MQYEELHKRYGTHLSQRLRRELDPSEFKRITIGALPPWLEARAEAAHNEYLHLQKSVGPEPSKIEVARVDAASRQWRAAEDLAYIVAIAEDVCLNARIS